MSYLFEPIILASASPRRAELLRDAFIPFEVCPSHAEEIKKSDCTAAFLVKKNALLKAMDVAKQYPSRLVLGADTIVYRKGKLYGKPMNRHDAERMLEELQGKMHQVITGVALLCLDEGVKRVFDVVTDVEFKSLSLKQIDEYIDLANPLDMAGAYGIQIYGGLIIEKIRGSYSNVVGLPLDELRQVLDELKKRF